MTFWSAINLEFYVLIILFIGLGILAYMFSDRFNDKITKTTTTESFEDYYHLKGCPPGYKTSYDNDGDIICCDGEIMANKCLGDRQCTLGNGTPDMPNCVFALLNYYGEKGKEYCPPSMPQYFENKELNIKACTNGRLNQTLDYLQDRSQPACVIYDDWNHTKNNIDSCFNQRQLDNAQCFGDNCTKQLMKPVPDAPPLVAIGFTDQTGMHRVAYSRQSLVNFLDTVNPSWRNQGMDLSVNINVAEVAKAYYIDKTMDQSQIQF